MMRSARALVMLALLAGCTEDQRPVVSAPAPAVPTPAPAATARTGFVADPRTGCLITDDWVQRDHRVTWSGGCVNGLAEGPGVLVAEYFGTSEARHTDRYEGPMRAGKRHGRGVTLYQTAQRTLRTEATWHEGLIEGPYLITGTDGYSDEGTAVNGRAEGHARIRYADGGTFEGTYLNGRRDGRGVERWADGDRYEGEFRNGLREGRGTYQYSTGDRYEGGWLAGKRHGRGTMQYADGARYEGEWQDGDWHGQGSYVSPNGHRYVGGHRAGLRHGRGSYTWPNGNVYDGEWAEGYADGQGSHRYFGEWRSGRWNRGCLRFAGGTRSVAPEREGGDDLC